MKKLGLRFEGIYSLLAININLFLHIFGINLDCAFRIWQKQGKILPESKWFVGLFLQRDGDIDKECLDAARTVDLVWDLWIWDRRSV